MLFDHHGTGLSACVAACFALLAATDVLAQSAPNNLDVRANGPRPGPATSAPAGTPPVARAEWSEQYGVPTVVWPVRDAVSASSSGDTVADARAYLEAYAPLYGLDASAVSRARVQHVHDTGRGGIAVLFEQRIGGVELFDQRLAVVLDRDHRLVGLTGFLSPLARPELADPTAFAGDAAARAIALAFADRYGAPVDPGDLVPTGEGGYGWVVYAPAPGAALALGLAEAEPTRVKPVYFALPDRLEPAFYLELVGTLETGRTDGWAYVVSAVDGAVLVRRSLVQDAGYFVQAQPTTGRPLPHPLSGIYPHPTGSLDWEPPPEGLILATAVVMDVPNGLFEVGDPWVPDGLGVVLDGNNAFAYLDVSGWDGFDALDSTLPIGSNGVFGGTFGLPIDPTREEASAAALTQSFYVVNYLHDFFYAHGFDEGARNGQAANYGRPGQPRDALLVELQDQSGLFNANMFTPADGARPRMQMFLFPAAEQTLDLGSSGTVRGASATFAPIYEVFAPIALVEGGGGLGLDDPCGGVGGDLTGTIAVAELSGECGADSAMRALRDAGAAGAVLVAPDDAPGDELPRLGCSSCSNGIASDLNIPGLAVWGSHFQAHVDYLEANPDLWFTLRADNPPRDAGLDSTIVVHEWGHYLVGRLLGSPSNNQGGALNEGLADLVALLVLVGANDPVDSDSGELLGVYPGGQYALYDSPEDLYFGVRRAPYSPDFAVNPFTFGHIANGAPEPTGAPLRYYQESFNAEVHASGEIFANALWSGFSLMVAEHGVDEARSRLADVLVLALQLAPSEPTFTEMRDAFAMAAAAGDARDAAALWTGFAARGLGLEARSPERFSEDHVGVIESFVHGPAYAIVDVSVTVSDVDTCDGDMYWDVGERATVRAVVRNIGSAESAETTVRVSSPSPGLDFPFGDTVSLGALAPATEVGLALDVVLSASPADDLRTIEVAALGSGPSEAGTVVVPTHLDATLEGETRDDVRGPSVWAVDSSPVFPRNADWRIVAGGSGEHYWHADNASNESDAWLVSPPLEVSATEPFTLELDHRFDFSRRFGANRDGGVIELSFDDGATWRDVTFDADAGYPGLIATAGELGWPDGAANVLGGRWAYVGTSAGYPGWRRQTLDFGMRLAGETVRLRFRAASDSFWGADGWDVDNLAFHGLDNAPFPAVLDEDGLCLDAPPVARATIGANYVQERGAVTVDGSGSSDPWREALAFAWTQREGPTATFEDATAAATAVVAPTVLAPDRMVFELRVTADGRVSEPAEVRVTVIPVNDAPDADAGPDQVVVERVNVVLDGSASSDPEGEDLDFAWLQVAGPAVPLEHAREAQTTFVSPFVDETTDLRFELTVDDGESASEPDEVTITVEWVPPVNHAPLADAGPAAWVVEGSPVRLDGSYSGDPDGDELTYAWTQSGGPAVALSDETAPLPTFVAPAIEPGLGPATLRFALVVSDGELESAPDTVEVTVLPLPETGEDVPRVVKDEGCAVGGGRVPGWVGAVFVLVVIGLGSSSGGRDARDTRGQRDAGDPRRLQPIPREVLLDQDEA